MSHSHHGHEEEQHGISITPESVLLLAIKVPGIKIDRSQFLRKELSPLYPDSAVEKAISYNPAQAGIPKDAIEKIARQCIDYETKKVSAISFVAGLPGGVAMAATIPADITQYFGFILRIMQKLAYLYGFDEFDLSEEHISDGTMDALLVFLGVMFGVQEANAGVKIVADVASKRVAKTLAQRTAYKRNRLSDRQENRDANRLQDDKTGFCKGRLESGSGHRGRCDRRLDLRHF